MEAIDKLINNYITPTSVTAGVGTVFLSFFTGKIAPKMPQKFYKLLDNILVKFVIVAFLLNQQIRKPSLSLIISVILVVGIELVIKFVAPDTPPLSEIVKPTEEENKNKPNQGCNCFCGHTIYTDQRPKDGGKDDKGNHNQDTGKTVVDGFLQQRLQSYDSGAGQAQQPSYYSPQIQMGLPMQMQTGMQMPQQLQQQLQQQLYPGVMNGYGASLY